MPFVEFYVDAVCDLKCHGTFFNGCNLAVHATGSYYVIPFLQRFQQGFMLLGLLLLRTDEKKVENCKHDNKRDQTRNPGLRSTGAATGRGSHSKSQTDHLQTSK